MMFVPQIHDGTKYLNINRIWFLFRLLCCDQPQEYSILQALGMISNRSRELKVKTVDGGVALLRTQIPYALCAGAFGVVMFSLPAPRYMNTVPYRKGNRRWTYHSTRDREALYGVSH